VPPVDFYTLIGKENVAALGIRNVSGMPRIVWNTGNGTTWFLGSMPLTSNALATGTKYRVAATYNSSSGEIYIDGSLNVSGPFGSGGTLGTNGILPSIASHFNGSVHDQFFNGLIDEIIVYDAKLSNTLILNDYNAANQ
jgi:hypothetical protein